MLAVEIHDKIFNPSLGGERAKFCQEGSGLTKYLSFLNAEENERRAGADLGKIVTDLLQNERRRRKLLGGCGGMLPREIFSILTT